MSELRKNIKIIERNIRIIKAEVIAFVCLTSFLAGILVARLIWG